MCYSRNQGFPYKRKQMKYNRMCLAQFYIIGPKPVVVISPRGYGSLSGKCYLKTTIWVLENIKEGLACTSYCLEFWIQLLCFSFCLQLTTGIAGDETGRVERCQM